MLSSKFENNNGNNNGNNNDFERYIKISDYIYNNFDKFKENEQIKKYIANSEDIINRYKIIWNNIDNNIDNNRIISNIIALNLSRITWDQVAELKIEYFPTLRLYKQGGEIVNFENDSKSQNIYEFLKKNGIN